MIMKTEKMIEMDIELGNYPDPDDEDGNPNDNPDSPAPE